MAFGLSKTTQIYTSQEARKFILKKIEEIGQDKFDTVITGFAENQTGMFGYKIQHHLGAEKDILSFYAGKKDKLVDNFWLYIDYPRIIFLNS